jgi:hypothetical protein
MIAGIAVDSIALNRPTVAPASSLKEDMKVCAVNGTLIKLLSPEVEA